MRTMQSENRTPESLLRTIHQKAVIAREMHFDESESVEDLKCEIEHLLREKDAVIVAHYYVAAEIQSLAEETGGHVADSLDMAYFGNEHTAQKLVVSGVRFMGETAKILTPDKTVLMPTLEATCSLDIGCPVEAFKEFKAQYPDRISVVYANTSAAVKAEADWVVTSGNALQIVQHLKEQGEKILWAPDRHLGNWIQAQTGADMINWRGHCVVHDEFKSDALLTMMKDNPDAVVIAHPESPAAVLEHAEIVGSTKVLINAVNKHPATRFIVATDEGIFHKMKQIQSKKSFIVAPSGGKGATCESCGKCPWMAINRLQNIRDCLKNNTPEIEIEESIRKRALVPIQRMLDFSRQNNMPIRMVGDA